MKLHPSLRAGLGLFLLMAFAVGVAEAGVRVKLESVPKPAVKAVKDRFTTATIRYVDKESSGNYEFAMEERKRQFDVGVTPAGKLFNVKEEMAEEKVPKAVKEGLAKKHPGAKIVETEKVIAIDGKKEKVTYELKIQLEKKTMEILLDEKGGTVDNG